MDEQINKDKIEPIVDKTIVHITNAQLTQIENNFHKLRNKNTEKKTYFFKKITPKI